jgi:hypothetical protein
MTFRNKILLSIWSVVLSLLVITFFIINYWTRDRVENTFSRELRANYSTIRVLTELQAETLVRPDSWKEKRAGSPLTTGPPYEGR